MRAFKIEPPPFGQRKVRVETDAYRLPGVVLHDHRNAVRNAAGANIRIACGLLAAEGLQALVQIVIADKRIDPEIRAAQQRAAKIEADIA